MTTCPNCGTHLRQADRYCPTCDAPNQEHRFPKFRPRSSDLPSAAADEPPRRPALRAFSCPRCDATVAPGSWLCAGCGLDVAKLLAQPERTPLDGVWTTPGPSSTTAYQPLRWWTTAWRTALWGAALVSLALTTLLAFVAAVGVDSSGVLPFDPDLASLGGIATLGLQVFSLGVVAVLLVAVGWTNRAYRNLEALGTGPSRIAPDLVAAAWFVPFVNLAVPVMALRDIWRGSDPRLPFRSDAWRSTKVTVPITESWIMSLVGGVAVAVGWWGISPASTWTSSVSSSSALIASLGHLLVAIGLIQLAIVADSVTERQRERSRRIGPPEALVRLGIVPAPAETVSELMEDGVVLRSIPGGAAVHGRY